MQTQLGTIEFPKRKMSLNKGRKGNFKSNYCAKMNSVGFAFQKKTFSTRVFVPIRELVFILFHFVGCTLVAQENKTEKKMSFEIPLTEKYWSSVSDNVEFKKNNSVSIASSNNNQPITIQLEEVVFSIGTIEFDVKLNGTGFPGINFRVDETGKNSETFYLRHFGEPNVLNRTTVQYCAVIDDSTLWNISDQYQGAALLKEIEWNHIKLVVSTHQMKAYVNDMVNAALHVPILEGITTKGAIRLSGNVSFANMVLTPGGVEDLPAGKGYDYTEYDPYYLKNWQVRHPIPFPVGLSIMKKVNRNPGVAIDEQYYDPNANWDSISAGPRSLINLNKKFGKSERGERRLIWLRTTITSNKPQDKKMRIGFSDEIWVFINGKPLYQDKNFFGSPGMKEPKGRCSLDNSVISVPFQEGENEILIWLSNTFFGWGLMARWSDMDGLSF